MSDLHDAAPSSAAAPITPTTPTPVRTGRRFFTLTVLLCVLPLLLLGAVLSLPFTARGSAWLLAALPSLGVNVQVEQPQGALLRGDFQASRLTVPMGTTRHLSVEQLRWQGLRWSWTQGAPHLQVTRLEADRIALRGPSDGQPVRLPTRLTLPLGLQIDAIRVRAIEADDLGAHPIQEARAALTLAPGPRAVHTLRGLSLRWDQLQATGEATLDAAAPLNLKAGAEIDPVAAHTAPGDWHMSVQGQGPLADLSLVAQLRGHGQSLDAQARLQLEQPWPVARLQARLEALDLAALASNLPRTALSGELDLGFEPAAQAGKPLGLRLNAALRNSLAGAWSTGQLPVRRLDLLAHSDAQQPEIGHVEALQLELGSASQSAGQVQGEGRWAVSGTAPQRRLALQLTAQLTEVRPARLDSRAPALQLGGPLAWDLDLALDAARNDTLPGAPPAWQTTLTTDLEGQLMGAGLPAARLKLAADAHPQKLHVQDLQIQAGAARLQARGELQRTAALWKLQLESELRAFDPSLWWHSPATAPLPQRPPADSTRTGPDSTLQRLLSAGPHRLDGRATLDLQLPQSSQNEHGLGRLALLQGQAQVDLMPSLLAGQPVSGRLALHSTRVAGKAPAAKGAASAADLIPGVPVPRDLPRLVADIDLRLGPPAASQTVTDPGPNAIALQAHGELDPLQAQDRWRLAWQSSSFERLQPWLRLFAPQQTALRLSGSSVGEAEIDGRWPRLRSSGHVSLPVLQWSERSADAITPAATPAATTSIDLRDLSIDWRLGSQSQDPLVIQARLAQLQTSSSRLQDLTLQASGTSAAHEITFALAQAGPVKASAESNGNGNNPLPSLWAARLQAKGSWLNEPAEQRLGWQGLVQQLELRAAEVKTGASAKAATTAAATLPAPLLLLQPTALSLISDPTGLHLSMGATRLALLDARLALDELDWRRASTPVGPQAGAPGARLQLRARLEPLIVAPLLVRAQPGFGWGGDLRLAGQINVRSTPEHFQADADIHRESGDLTVTDLEAGSPPQRLGLVGLKLALAAHDGRWQLSQLITGGNLGYLLGEQTVTAPPQALWPDARAPVQGKIDLQVAQLGNWGRWLPAGWRLTGRLGSQARVSGRFGAPEFSGELAGDNIAVRNVLQGVDWRDAQVKVTLAGDTARIDTFSVRAGNGTLSASGDAQLGATPRAVLKIRADHFAALQRVDRRVVASGEADLTFDALSTTLKGRVQADEGRFDFTQSDAPSLADDVRVVRAETEALQRERAAAPRSRRTVTLDLRTDLGPAFVLKGRGLNTRLAGELRLTSPNNKLAVQGNIQAVDGTYAAYGQKLRVDRSIISFSGPPENPRLDIEATRPDLEDVRVGVAVTGTAQNPRIRLFSEPTMSDTDRLSWLLLGRASDGLGRTDLALLQRAAYALIAGESDSPSLIERVGLNQFSVRQADTDTRETVVTLGKQLSRRWYLGYERSLNAASGTWQLIYRLAQRFTLRAQSGSENALDLIWTWKWGQPGLMDLREDDKPDKTETASPPVPASSPAR